MHITQFTDYLSLEKKYSLHTVNAYVKDVTSFSEFCKSTFSNEEIDEVSYHQIRNWIVALVEEGVSNRSINRKVASLKAYYKYLLKIKIIEFNPLAKHKALKTSKKIEVPFSEKEMESVLIAVDFEDTFEGWRDKLIIELFYATGMRRSELINIKLNDIDFSACQIKILGKRNKERIVPLLNSVLQNIQKYLVFRENVFGNQELGYLFLLSSGNKLYDTFVYRVINSYFSKASLKEKKSPHVLRHTFATHILNKGADLNSVKELLGHSSLASTQVYTHNSINELKNVYKNAHPRNKK
ncbi:tyrosine-type recombinase/integrase [Zhouia sp. PK063]|uniref:tyrosine-type recombinase/integrase n=1 Tax=Zhouia sp. PK063 TaxID=3373602 RepID=UPI0037AFC8D3